MVNKLTQRPHIDHKRMIKLGIIPWFRLAAQRRIAGDKVARAIVIEDHIAVWLATAAL